MIKWVDFCKFSNPGNSGIKSMLTHILPKLPMRSKSATRDFYINQLGFQPVGVKDFEGYLMLQKDYIELHFFAFPDLNPLENYGQVYIRTDNIETLYQSLLNQEVPIHPNGALQTKPWGQKEFSLLDPDHNLLTFGQSVINV
jgi:catechol 2,3-dioxygenase-like lactoylglutathione lyase family enzyme